MSSITESEHDITFLIVHLSEGRPVLDIEQKILTIVFGSLIK